MENIEKYIDELYEKQNMNADSTQKNLCSREYYEKKVNNVLNVLKDNPDADIQELRTILRKNSGLEDSLKHFIYDRQMAPGLVTTYGTKNYQETIVLGNQEEVKVTNNGLVQNEIPMNNDTIFDLASCTKMFTAIATLELYQMGLINLDDQITKYAPQFENLKDVTIYDLLTFLPLKTNERVDSANSIEEAEKTLFTAERNTLPEGANPYNDIAPMVLKYVIEEASNMDYYDFLKLTILDELNMQDTLVKIPDKKLLRVASGNYDTRYYKDGNIVTRDYITPGISTDDKARVLGQPYGILSGHAGLFSTASDMSSLAKGLIDNKILNLDIRREMSKNKTGKMFLRKDCSKGFVQYFGMLCYSKNPNVDASEVYHPLSGESFAGAGWSGTQITVDPINNLNFFMGANRSHNRLTIIDPSHKDKIKTDELGRKSIILPNGKEVIDASRFAFDRDEKIVHPALDLALQYKILEDIIGNNDKSLEGEKTLNLTK